MARTKEKESQINGMSMEKIVEIAKISIRSYCKEEGSKVKLSDHDLNDIAYEILTRVWVKQAKYDSSKASMGTWVSTIARNFFKSARTNRENYYRRATSLYYKDENHMEFLKPQISSLHCTGSQTDYAVREKQSREITISVMNKKLSQRDVKIVKQMWDGFSNSEISDSEGCSAGCVGTRLSRARRAIKKDIYAELQAA